MVLSSALGDGALFSNNTGDDNSALGVGALEFNTTGEENSALGNQALLFNTGSNNTALGASAGYNNSNGSGNLFLGYQAGYNETGSNKLYIANSQNTSLIYGDFSTGMLGLGGTAANTNPYLYIADSSNVGIGTTNPQYALDVLAAGTGVMSQFANASGNCTISVTGLSCSSDENLKKNITASSYGLDAVMALSPVEYNWKTDGNNTPKTIGFIAQQVQQVLPTLVSTGDNGHETLNEMGMIPVLTEALQQQEGQIETMANNQLSMTDQLTMINDQLTVQGQSINSLITQLGTATQNITSVISEQGTMNNLVAQLQSQLNDQTLSANDKLDLIGQELSAIADSQDAITKQIADSNDQIISQQKLIAELQDQMKTLQQENQAVIDFASALNVNSLIYKDSLGNLDLGEGKITAKEIDVDTVEATDVTATDTVSGNAFEMGSNASGQATIKAGDTGTTIATPYATQSAKISITPAGSTQGKVLYYDQIVSGQSFNVEIDKPALDSDINFTWLIIK